MIVQIALFRGVTRTILLLKKRFYQVRIIDHLQHHRWLNWMEGYGVVTEFVKVGRLKPVAFWTWIGS
jgi:hypothetical protein